jgi:predicted CxxxxCH...CXXCH cytochrome family protein
MLPDLTSFKTLIDCREDGTPWVAGGDPRSLLLTALDRPDHQGTLDPQKIARLRSWVVDQDLEYTSSLGHERGWSTSHKDALKKESFARAYDPSAKGACAGCHGQPIELGGAIACSTCHGHEIAQDRCDTCHGANGNPRPVKSRCDPPESRSSAPLHAIHTDPAADAAYPAIACTTCHAVPRTVTSTVHFVSGVDRGAVRLDASRFLGASYDPATRSCSVRPCHLDQAPRWTDTATSARCDSCHDAPPKNPNHVVLTACTTCHAEAFAANGRPDGRFHMDGTLHVGKKCDACHGNPPPPSALGDPGAHAIHLTENAFRAGVACDACHVVPDRVDAPGHIDHDAPVVRFHGDDATFKNTLTPVWDPVTKTCSDVGCHGAELDRGQRITPVWTSTASLVCGSCHGLPPLTVRGGQGIHLPTGPADCGACHRTPSGAPISRFTEAITEEGKREHINGCIDLRAGCAP